MTTILLAEPIIFPEFNQQKGFAADTALTEIKLNTLKYKHFRDVIKYPEEEQMHRLMLAVTGLSEDDMGELTPNDAASISQYILDSMKKYFELGQKVIKDLEK